MARANWHEVDRAKPRMERAIHTQGAVVVVVVLVVSSGSGQL